MCGHWRRRMGWTEGAGTSSLIFVEVEWTSTGPDHPQPAASDQPHEPGRPWGGGEGESTFNGAGHGASCWCIGQSSQYQREGKE